MKVISKPPQTLFFFPYPKLVINMDNFGKGKAKLKVEEEYASHYLRGKCFSRKDIYGEEIYKETAIIDKHTMKLDRLPPMKSYINPLAYFDEVAEIKKKALVNNMNTEKGGLISKYPQEISTDAWNNIDSPLEISDDAWNEGPSARNRAKYEGEPSNRHR